jgi:glycosyltransferase involved in cell wall biosynthesis
MLWLAGEGAMAAEMANDTDRVRVVDALDRGELARFFSALDVLVLPSQTTPGWKEQFGRVIVEAQGCGIPVVGSSSGAIPEVLGEPLLIFPESDEKALVRILERLRVDPLWRARLGREGRERSVQRYSWESIAKQMLEVYRELAPAVAGEVEARGDKRQGLGIGD